MHQSNTCMCYRIASLTFMKHLLVHELFRFSLHGGAPHGKFDKAETPDHNHVVLGVLTHVIHTHMRTYLLTNLQYQHHKV